MMKSSKILVQTRLLNLATTKSSLQWNSRRFLHVMNKDVTTIGGNDEQPHMRMEAQKRM